MTRKDYILIAEALRKAHAATPISSALAIQLVSDALQKDNPKFNRDHFLAVVRGNKSLTSRPSRNGRQS